MTSSTSSTIFYNKFYNKFYTSSTSSTKIARRGAKSSWRLRIDFTLSGTSIRAIIVSLEIDSPHLSHSAEAMILCSASPQLRTAARSALIQSGRRLRPPLEHTLSDPSGMPRGRQISRRTYCTQWVGPTVRMYACLSAVTPTLVQIYF